ncbi:hypothetical protein C8F01DRAFT_1122293 [Mycena amicta]|nr:hypothetical protein C8F01DRAFT_1122293 [Mycena amicta]
MEEDLALLDRATLASAVVNTQTKITHDDIVTLAGQRKRAQTTGRRGLRNLALGTMSGGALIDLIAESEGIPYNYKVLQHAQEQRDWNDLTGVERVLYKLIIANLFTLPAKEDKQEEETEPPPGNEDKSDESDKSDGEAAKPDEFDKSDTESEKLEDENKDKDADGGGDGGDGDGDGRKKADTSMAEVTIHLKVVFRDHKTGFTGGIMATTQFPLEYNPNDSRDVLDADVVAWGMECIIRSLPSFLDQDETITVLPNTLDYRQLQDQAFMAMVGVLERCSYDCPGSCKPNFGPKYTFQHLPLVVSMAPHTPERWSFSGSPNTDHFLLKRVSEEPLVFELCLCALRRKLHALATDKLIPVTKKARKRADEPSGTKKLENQKEENIVMAQWGDEDILDEIRASKINPDKPYPLNTIMAWALWLLTANTTTHGIDDEDGTPIKIQRKTLL